MVTLTAVRPSKLIPRADLQTLNLRKEVFQHGMRIQWEMAAECPCTRVFAANGKTGSTLEGRLDCAECQGTRILYHSAQEILGIVAQSQLITERFQVYGEYARGMTTVTVLPEHMPSVYDRYTLLDNVIVFRESLIRKATVEAPRYPILRRTLELADPDNVECGLKTTRGVLYARRADSIGALLGNVMVEGVDFTVTDAGEVDWTLGDGLTTAPAVGSRYSLQYYANPRYVVQDQPYVFRDTYVALKSESALLTNTLVTVDARLEWWRQDDP